MASLILPVTVESRKVLLIDLHPELPEPFANEEKDFKDDIFIVRLPEGGISETFLFEFSKQETIKSLLLNHEDIEISKMGFQYVYDSDTHELQIIMKPGFTGIDKVDNQLSDTLFWKIENLSDVVKIGITKEPSFTRLVWKELYVTFRLQIQGQNQDFVSYALLYLVKASSIQLVALDFGSESSQMNEGRYVDYTNINQKSVNLFECLKEKLIDNSVTQNIGFVQYENNKLYKSIFYAPKSIEATESEFSMFQHPLYNLHSPLNILTTVAALNANHTRDFSQIPNLKLVRDNHSIASELKFSIRNEGISTTEPFSQLRGSFYSKLLEEMILSYVNKKVTRPSYLKITLLVPNIYSVDEIYQTKLMIRRILETADSEGAQKILGLEVSTLSESDASFQGYALNDKVEDGKYYIVVDCGKGTTDFSVLEIPKGKNGEFKPIYRNGFAGAGNLVTFAYLQAMIYFLKKIVGEVDPNLSNNIEEFLSRLLIPKEQTPEKHKLFEILEKWKKNHDQAIDLGVDNVRGHWLTAKTGSTDINNLFEEVPSADLFLKWLGKVDYCWDWGDFINNTINAIAENIEGSLKHVIRHLNKSGSCGGIILTGRAFNYKPLKNQVSSTLINMERLAKTNVSQFTSAKLKEICLDGVFGRDFRSHSDVSSTPIEKVDNDLYITEKTGLFSGIIQSIRKLVESLRKIDRANFGVQNNSIPVLNKDLVNCRFFVGGRMYQPDWNSTGKVEQAYLIQTRSSMYIIAGTADKKKRIVPLKVVPQDITFSEENVMKSLFPGWLDESLSQQILK